MAGPGMSMDSMHWNMASLITRTGTFYITYAELAHLHTGGPVAYRLNPYVTVPR